MVAARLTFYGACKDAVDFYCKVFGGKIMKQTLFRENMEQFPMGLSEEMGELIYSVTLQIPDEDGGSYICMGDSPILAFTGVQDAKACKDNVIFEVKVSSDAEVERIYSAFMADGAKCNIAVCEKEGYSRYASFIDKFVVCWNVYCEK